MQQTVRLLGDLGERYGVEHEYYNLRTPADAIKLLCINKPELMKELAEAHEHGIGYRMIQAGTDLDYADLQLPLGSNDLILTPVITGSGGGSNSKILIGIGLIALSFVLPGAGLFGTTSLFGASAVAGGLGTAIGTALSAIGASLVLGGVSQLLSPQPQIPSLSGAGRLKPGENTNASGSQGVSRATSGEQSYAFQGPANTVGVGNTVPLIYGEVLTGSQLLSSNVEITDESDKTSEYFERPGPDSVTVNGEKVTFKFASLSGLRTRRWSDENRALVHNNTEVRRSMPSLDFTQAGKEQRDVDYREFTTGGPMYKNFQVMLEIDRGLFNVVGNTKVPGFVTYEIKLSLLDTDQGTVDGGLARATIQGLLKPGEPYRWCHSIAYTKLSGGLASADTRVQATVRIIDFDCKTRPDGKNLGRLRVRSIGFLHFKNGQDFTQGLSST